MQGALQRAVADNPELAQQEPALLRLANKVLDILLALVDTCSTSRSYE